MEPDAILSSLSLFVIRGDALTIFKNSDPQAEKIKKDFQELIDLKLAIQCNLNVLYCL